jgi:hypothetical protein
VHLLLQKYLTEKYHQTAYSTNVYLTLGPMARQLTRHTRESIDGLQGVKVECVFRKKAKKPRVQKPPSKAKAGKRKRGASLSGGENDEDIVIVSGEEDEEEDCAHRGQVVRRYEESGEDDDDDTIDDWSHTMRNVPPPAKKQRRKSTLLDRLDGANGTVIRENNKEVLVLSD